MQLRAWPTLYGDLVPAEAIPSGPGGRGGRGRGLACSSTSPATPATGSWSRWSATGWCGFAITGPATDPDCDPVADAELRELTVDPDERGKGHGSRLLQAAADTMTADRFTRAVTWVDRERRRAAAFLDRRRLGARRRAPQLDLDGTVRPVKQVRLHTCARRAGRQDLTKPARVVSVRRGRHSLAGGQPTLTALQAAATVL